MEGDHTAKGLKGKLATKPLLEPFGITRYHTDYWGAYTRHLNPDEHNPGKRNTQQIERKHLT
jgi:insertion element IS1 protein InsB